MRIFDDRQAALEELQSALLADEEEEALLPEESEEDPILVYRNYSNNYGRDLRNFASGYAAYNTDSADTDPEVLSEQLQEPPKERLGGLMATALVLLGGIIGILLWWGSALTGG